MDLPIVQVFYTWELCLAEFNYGMKYSRTLEFIHFSDTFLIYAPDASKSSLVEMERASRLFFEFVLLRQIPLRGAMACDEFYADKSNGVFLGKALVEAHGFGEGFDWIGYVLCPSAIENMSLVGLPASQGGYANYYKAWDAPMKNGSKSTKALLCGTNLGNGQDVFVRALEDMKTRTQEEMARKNCPPDETAKVTVKYDNSIRFLNHFNLPNSESDPTSSHRFGPQ
jgi:hypothetical protein